MKIINIIYVAFVIVFFAASCATNRHVENKDLLDVIRSTWIFVDTDEMLHQENILYFFPNLNELLEKTHPDVKIPIYVDSNLLPSSIKEMEVCIDKSDPFYKSLEQIRREKSNWLTTKDHVILYDLLKLYCALTGRQMTVEKDKILIRRDRRPSDQDCNFVPLF